MYAYGLCLNCQALWPHGKSGVDVIAGAHSLLERPSAQLYDLCDKALAAGQLSLPAEAAARRSTVFETPDDEGLGTTLRSVCGIQPLIWHAFSVRMKMSIVTQCCSR